MNVVLDTNVLSEVLRVAPSPVVMEWLAVQPARSLFVSTVTEAEMLLAARLLPVGKRRQVLEQKLELLFGQRFANRLLVFDEGAARHYADLVAVRRRAGRPVQQFDGQIAAIALANDMRVATRNVDDFTGYGLSLENPWG